MVFVEQEKISEFVTHLLSNPNVKGENLLIAEGIVLNFIADNIGPLSKTFQSPGFFPSQPPKKTLGQIFQELYKRIENSVLPVILSHIDLMDFDVMVKLYPASTFDNNTYRDIFKKFITEIFKNKDVRYNFDPVLKIFQLKAIEKYLHEIFRRRSALYIELVRVQQNNLKEDEYINYLKILLLIKNAAFIRIAIDPDNESNKVNVTDFIDTPQNLDNYIQNASTHFQQSLGGVPGDVIRMAFKSNLKCTQVENEDASAKLLNIMDCCFRSYKDYGKIDRGAEAPNKSWFAVIKKNINSYAFDRRMIDDLYFIAGDNNW